MKRVAIIVPCYNEEESLPALFNAIKTVKDKINDYQIDLMLINDGSSDKTQSIIKDLAKNNKWVYFREFAHNTGHQSAIRAGIDASTSYDAAIMLDADLQHPPEYIPKIIDCWSKSGCNIVQMLRQDTAREAGQVKYWTSKLYYTLINYLSGLNLEYGSSDFRLIDNKVIKAVASSPETNLFLRGYFAWINVKKESIQYKPSARFAGASKYTFKKMLALARQGILQFSEKPLRLAMNIGSIVALVSFLYGVYLIIGHIVGFESVSGWTSLMVVMLFCFGINFVLIGFIGRYLMHAITLQKQRPEYIVANEKLSNIN